MTRIATTFFGSFGERLSTGVYADGWWFFLASDVELETETRVSHDLAAFMPESATKALRPVPKRMDLEWFRDVAPIGLQIGAELVRLQVVALRVEMNFLRSNSLCSIFKSFVIYLLKGCLSHGYVWVSLSVGRIRPDLDWILPLADE
jgi:hypothetical protein